MASLTCPYWDEESSETSKGEHVLGLTNVCFEKDRPCCVCQAEK
jgi:hypothetical protein